MITREFLVVDQDNKIIGLGWVPVADREKAEAALEWCAVHLEELRLLAEKEDLMRGNEWTVAYEKQSQRVFRIVTRTVSSWVDV